MADSQETSPTACTPSLVHL